MTWLRFFFSFFFSFSGRIDRLGYAVGLILPAVLCGFGYALIFMMLGETFVSIAPTTNRPVADQQALFAQGMKTFLQTSLTIVPLFFLSFLISLALSARRLHDLNKTAWWLLAPLGVAVLALIASMISAPVGMVAHLGSAAFSIWLTIQMMFFRGSAGDNDYGPRSDAMIKLVGGNDRPEKEPQWRANAVKRTTTKTQVASAAASVTRVVRLPKLPPAAAAFGTPNPAGFGRRNR